MYIPPDKVQYIQSVVPIEDVIWSTGYKVIGTGYSKGINICPRCKRDHTHIKINSKKNLFNCFSASCNFRGNQFHWIMEVDNVSFPEAVKRVAEIGNIKLELSNEEKIFDENKQKALKLALNFFRCHNDNSNYLEKRGISKVTQEVFQVGFAPGGALLKKYLNEHSFSNEFLLNIGLIRKVNGNKLMDRFYNSVIIPDIRNGKVYDFYSRSIDPKIKNKHQYLYGYRSLIGWHTVKSNDDVYVLEAPIDAMSLYQLNGKGVFSIGGATKFDNWHIYHIKNKNLKPIFALDNDETGKLETVEAINLCKEHNIDTKVLTFDTYKDINEILQNSSFNVFRLIKGQHFIYKHQLSQIPVDFIKDYLKSI